MVEKKMFISWMPNQSVTSVVTSTTAATPTCLFKMYLLTPMTSDSPGLHSSPPPLYGLVGSSAGIITTRLAPSLARSCTALVGQNTAGGSCYEETLLPCIVLSSFPNKFCSIVYFMNLSSVNFLDWLVSKYEFIINPNNPLITNSC